MCGIAGVMSLNGRHAPKQLAEWADAMVSAFAYRGPDDRGLWLADDGRCALAHCRLSILDMSQAGHQPMLDVSRRSCIVFNGEIYNHQSLSARLQDIGVSFMGHSDTEVLVNGLVREGTDFLTRLEGMFALAYYDRERRELLLARDPFGEKPLYYAEFDGLLVFASELAALSRVPGFPTHITVDTVAHYLAFQHPVGGRTLYQHAKKLLPGHLMRAVAGEVSQAERYFHFICAGDHIPSRPLEEQVDQLEELLLRSLSRRLVADVPVGAFLSGGVDSSTAVALITRRLQRPIRTFSIGFAQVRESEHEEARAFADFLGTEHTEQLLRPEAFVEQVGDLARLMDEPNADTSCVPTYMVSQLARQQVTVAITGDGGDELFGGYGRYLQTLAAAEGREQQMQARSWHLGREYYSGRILLYADRQLEQLFGRIPSGTGDHLMAQRRRIDMDSRPYLNRLREADVANYLPLVLAKVDRMSMLHSLECRTPYLSTEVAQFAAGLAQSELIAQGQGKFLLRQLAKRYLPAEWIDRPKKGFSIDPFNQQAKQSAIMQLRQQASSGQLCLHQFIAPDRLRLLLDNQFEGMNFYHIWGLLVLEAWLQSHAFSL
ncbi:asparagine synthase (glutamine-hydrolyzing) [Aeromonas hydrophila]|uniref:asparagine synthase (glutamine-hydrolyzing) n=1 Tax=Aeromonas hydrophila TaxID=644 RepID=UPI00207CD46A|nr:asparagine synthase (glutamine-hydrolyzing) [Aeromonas hydrophila]MCO4213685.1 asparagine synthase (glutamine-hydrolyzing) [Aeromonas hydrophila]HDX8443370.1 asparagine synthase (glutamine-hydrolyzing) [Aeromonas hydrophila]HDX8634385.1 asparagine synthase (glutamine-hydrolyzing) [Aeromonas hydrophila]